MRAAELICLHTDQGVELMLLDLPLVGCGVGPRQFQTTVHTLADRCAGHVLDVGRELIQRSVAAVLGSGVVHAEYRADLQVLDGLQLYVGVGGQIAVLVLVVPVHLHRAIGVAVVLVPVGAAGVVQVSFGIIYRSQRRCVEGALQGLGHTVVLVTDVLTLLLGVDERHLLADFQKVTEQLVVGVDTEVVAREVGHVRTAYDTFLVQISGRDGVGACGGTARDTQGVALGLCAVMEHLVEPVGVDERAVGTVDALHVGPVVRTAAAVDVGLVHDGHVLARVKHICPVGHRLPAEVTVEGDLGLPFLTALGGDQHDAVGGLGTVDGGGGGILQHVDALDVGGIDVGDVTLDAVDQIEGTRVAHGAEATDVHLHSRARRSGLRGDVHTRHLALHGLQRTGGVHLGDLLALHL